MRHFRLILNTREQNLELIRACAPFDQGCAPLSDIPLCPSDTPPCPADTPGCLGTQGDVCSTYDTQQCEVGDEEEGCSPINDVCYSEDTSDCSTASDVCQTSDSEGGCSVYDSCTTDSDECQDAMDICSEDLC